VCTQIFDVWLKLTGYPCRVAIGTVSTDGVRVALIRTSSLASAVRLKHAVVILLNALRNLARRFTVVSAIYIGCLNSCPGADPT
jgi:hypothetical protein